MGIHYAYNCLGVPTAIKCTVYYYQNSNIIYN